MRTGAMSNPGSQHSALQRRVFAADPRRSADERITGKFGGPVASFSGIVRKGEKPNHSVAFKVCGNILPTEDVL